MDNYRRAALQLILVWVATALALSSGTTDFGGHAAAQDQRARDGASVTFAELNESGLSGTAELTDRGDRTAVAMRINGVVGEHPTHIHPGTCDDLDPDPKYPLNNVELTTTALVGTSDSVVDVSLDDLLASDHLILIHKSLEELDTYYACGNIVAGTAAETLADVGGTREGQALGDTGSGSMPAAASTLATTVALGVVAVTLGVVAWSLRRRALRG
jgi:hypothetical protein